MAPSRVTIDTAPSLDGQVVLCLSGELDLSDADMVRRALVAAVSLEPTVVVDLSGLSFIDVAGVRALRDAHNTALSCGSCLLLAAPPRCVTTVATLMELRRLPFCEKRPALDGGGSDGAADGAVRAMTRPGEGPTAP